ncbi:hypothetical protein CEJ86_30120 [Sinorhizobium meliloti]|uniref:Transmembrane anchor protein n=2 Tax=Rhizobium meliloti TaxID=382 RepID=A0A2J0YTZ5_RHIML|nr:hypothetical protein CEJ86_30120 [Sinorhizobium meliloti]
MSATTSPSRSRLVMQVSGALVAGTALTFLIVLPAEYGVDPTGFGALTGLNRLRAPTEVVVPTEFTAPPEIAKAEDTPFRTDTITITVPPFTQDFGAIEYKVTMKEGDTVVYSWKADNDLLYEFHGHSLATAEQPEMQVMNYIKGKATSGNGTLNVAIDGIHGWYWSQADFSEYPPKPTTVELKLAGYYKLEPGVLTMGRPTE